MPSEAQGQAGQEVRSAAVLWGGLLLFTKDLGKEVKPPTESVLSALTLAILLIDDDDLILRSTRMLLEVQGHNVTSASSGEEALALLAQGLRPDPSTPSVDIIDLGTIDLGRGDEGERTDVVSTIKNA